MQQPIPTACSHSLDHRQQQQQQHHAAELDGITPPAALTAGVPAWQRHQVVCDIAARSVLHSSMHGLLTAGKCSLSLACTVLPEAALQPLSGSCQIMTINGCLNHNQQRQSEELYHDHLWQLLLRLKVHSHSLSFFQPATVIGMMATTAAGCSARHSVYHPANCPKFGVSWP